jgi:uncharacterized membrane protein
VADVHTAKTADPVRSVTESLPLDDDVKDRLRTELRDLAAAEAQRLLMTLGRRLGEATVKLNDVAEGRGTGLAESALTLGRKMVQEGKGPVRGIVETGAGKLKDSVLGAFGGRGGRKGKGGSALKSTVVLEYVDVGVPARDAYNQWTKYPDFSGFTKGVQNVTVTEDAESDWKMRVFWSNRSWRARTTEQVPDHRIVWSAEGAKATAKGVVTFHPLAEDLTRVLLLIEYYPRGLFEKTANLWRAQGRRARLDLKHYARHVTLQGEVDDGWRGEIRDGEVVRSHEDAVAEEEEGYAEQEPPEAEEELEEEDGEYADEEYADEEPEDYEEEPVREGARERR